VDRYTEHPDYLSLLAALRAKPIDETTRLVLADWVQDQGDEAEAQAIRQRRSPMIDLLPAAKAVAVVFAVIAASARQAAGRSPPPSRRTSCGSSWPGSPRPHPKNQPSRRRASRRPLAG
jgi:uncharacterized protein (TIGR02996 family)